MRAFLMRARSVGLLVIAFSALFFSVTAARVSAVGASDYRINILNFGTRNSTTIQSALDSVGTAAATFFFPHGSYSITNDLTVPGTVTFELETGAALAISSGKTLTFSGADLAAGSYAIFTGAGTVTGTVNSLTGCWTNWNGMSGNYGLVCVGADVQGEDEAGGDLRGTLGDLQLNTGVVTTVEILDYTVASNDISTNAIYGFHIVDGTVTSNDIADGTIGTNDLSSVTLARFSKEQLIYSYYYTGTAFSVHGTNVQNAAATRYTFPLSNGVSGVSLPRSWFTGAVEYVTNALASGVVDANGTFYPETNKWYVLQVHGMGFWDYDDGDTDEIKDGARVVIGVLKNGQLWVEDDGGSSITTDHSLLSRGFPLTPFTSSSSPRYSAGFGGGRLLLKGDGGYYDVEFAPTVRKLSQVTYFIPSAFSVEIYEVTR